MEQIKVNKLKEGSTIGIFTPSEPITISRIERVKNGVRYLNEQGYNVVFAQNALKVEGYDSSSIVDRISDIRDLLLNDDIDALMSSWGGKSCNQLVGHLPYDLFKKYKKPVLGFSDPCVLLNHISCNTGLITFYGPNVLGKLNESFHSNLDFLKNYNEHKNILGKVDQVESKVLVEGQAEGRLIGGNLSTFILGVLNSKYASNIFEDAILFWESASNSMQIVDQYLHCLKNSGALNKIKGMIIGDYIKQDEHSWKDSIHHHTKIKELLSEYSFPVIYAPTFGHKPLENPIFPIGSKCFLSTRDRSLKLTEPILS